MRGSPILSWRDRGRRWPPERPAPRRTHISFEASSGVAGPATVGGGMSKPLGASRRSRPVDRRDRATVGAPPRGVPNPSVNIRELPVVTPRFSNSFYQRYGKRALDLFASSLALLLVWPLVLAIAVAIKLEDGGPIIYCSDRVGIGARVFRFYKFRSMVKGADTRRDSLQHLNEVDGPVFKMADDPRITRVGRWLRRTSLDELPQVWNVLRGDMTLVGPRPPIPDEVFEYEAWQLQRLSVRPGLTCLWQISGRSRIGFDEWMRLDMEYIDRYGFLLDLWILLRTIPAVVSGEGAY